MVRFKRKWNSGFTLIELLIVIAVIAVLVAILVPNFKSMRMEAKESKAKGDLKNLQTAVIIYINRNGVFPSDGVGVTSSDDLKVLLNEPKEYRSINDIPADPFSPTKAKYGFLTEGTDGTDGDISSDAYYIIFSVGRDEGADIAQADLSAISANDDILTDALTTDDIYVTNAKIP